MSIQIDIAINAGNWADESALNALVQRAVSQVSLHLNMLDVESELSVLMTDDVQVRQINAQWRNMDKPTNVLSFPAIDIEAGQKPGPLLGDIVIAFETVEREAALEQKTFDHHLTHLIIHGLLHLLGYDHENDHDADIMEKLETEILSQLGIADPHALEPAGS